MLIGKKKRLTFPSEEERQAVSGMLSDLSYNISSFLGLQPVSLP